ncbi:MAG: 5-oxoprolinase subunit PxpB [Agriterribacter sp.]
MLPPFPYRFHALGDSAVVIAFGNTMNSELNKYIIQLSHQLKTQQQGFITDILPAYSSLSVFYDLARLQQLKPVYTSGYDYVCNCVEKIMQQATVAPSAEETVIRIPVCYEGVLAPDIEPLAKQQRLSVNEVIDIHTTARYTVYMIGFLPGFAYMGEVDNRIATPRKHLPQKVTAGSVGIAGAQTGIYPIDSPGGWNIIGRTPLQMFDAQRKDPVLLKAGNIVQFYPISLHEYQRY